ncbi:TonB-dependent receptor [Massilia sp. erpn]|uniref:TonB-dependent receptor n=1 Tax=Massilia sp. erpn TaxID=2738142 RepID=UPI0021033F73|nr:TonB-dependent receptor [Massilia sp. erpn]UTY56748.1 TonB-dependent receptor [Massilia sp. erpn]
MKQNPVLKRSVIAVAMALAYAPAAMAQQAAAHDTQTVYVTGSNLKRTDKEGPLPVQVVTSKDIKDAGVSSVADLLRKLPSISGDGNFDTNGGAFASGVSTVSLRGLSSASTLILLNGRRMTPAAYADPNNGNSTLYDVNSIPLSALDRVEILKDGASAVYGSDAVGGVINFITKNNYQGVQLAARHSANDDGNFKKSGANAFYGIGDVDSNGYNVFFTVDVSKRQRVKRADATDIEVEQHKILDKRFATPYGSNVSSHPIFFRESSPGSENFAVSRGNAAQRLVIRTDCDPSQQLVGSQAMGFSAASVYIGRTFCNYDTPQYLEAQSEGKDASLMSRGVLKLSENTRAFAEVAYARSERNYTGAPTTIGTNPVTNFTSSSVGNPFQAILEIGHPDNPFPNARSSVAYRFENLRGGSQIVNDNIRLLTGLEGNWSNWSWETGLLWNQSKKKDTGYGYLYLPTLRKLNAGTSLAQLSADPTLGHDVVTNNSASILQLDARASTEFGALPGGAMGLALGVELRREKISLRPDDVLARGDILGLVNTVIQSERDVKSAFAELRAPLLKNLELDFAGRFDKYPGIKTNFVPKVGGKWTVFDGLAFRGSYAKGFRAPALVQTASGGAQYFLRDIFDPKRCEPDNTTPKPGATEADCGKTIAGVGDRNPDLVPEKSRSYNLGVVWAVGRDVEVTLDWFRIRKEGEVALGTPNDALKNEDRDPSKVQRNTNPANWVKDENGNPIPNTGPLLMVKTPWTNQGATEISGLDLELRHRLKMGSWGSLDSKLNTTYTHTYKVAMKPGDIEHNSAGTDPGLNDWALSQNTRVPRWKTTLSTNWSLGDHNVNLAINYIGPVSLKRVYYGARTYEEPFCGYGTPKPTDADPDRDATVPRYEEFYPKCAVKSWTTVALGYTYTGFKNLSLNFNIQNLFDKKAPYVPYSGISSTFQPAAGYDEGLHNNYGRYFNVSANYTF